MKAQTIQLGTTTTPGKSHEVVHYISDYTAYEIKLSTVNAIHTVGSMLVVEYESDNTLQSIVCSLKYISMGVTEELLAVLKDN